MRVRDGLMLREVVGEFVVVPVGQGVTEFNGLLTLSESSALIWRTLEKGASLEQLVQVICNEYRVDSETAKQDILDFVNDMIEKGFVVEEA